MRILLAPDKFKGTLDAAPVAEAMALGARDALPGADATVQPLADGGEGSLDCVAASGRRAFSTVSAEDAFGRPVEARVLHDDTVAMIAAHETQRLPDRPSPAAALRASSRGTGIALTAVRRSFPDHEIVVWVGGTASTDGGAGAAQAAGWRLLDARGRDLGPGGADLRRLARVEPPADRFGIDVCAACDVDNPLLGERGSARVFGPQKGAGPAELRVLQDGLEVLAERLQADAGIDVTQLRGGGAGGGLGAGLVAFFGARLEAGFERMARETGLGAQIGASDLVLTGEGRVDEGTLGGKVVVEVARLCAGSHKPCLVVAGEVALPAPLLPAARALGVAGVASLVDRCGRRESFEATESCVRSTVAALVERWLAPG